MKNKWIALAALGMAATSHAVVIDAFDYSLGTAEGGGSDAFAANSGPWGVNASWPAGIKIVQDAELNNYLAVGGGSEKGVYCDLGANAIADGGSGIYYYQVSSTSATVDYSVGLSDAASVGTWSDLEAYVNLKGDGTDLWLGARNGGGTDIVKTGLSVDAWYDIWLVVDNSADTYDVYCGSTMTPENLVADDFSFRNGVAANNLGTFGMYGYNTTDDAMGVDNIEAIPEPATFGMMAVFGSGILFMRRRFKK